MIAKSHSRLVKLLTILECLRTGYRGSVAELAYKFETNERTMYRYLEIIDGAGIVMDKDFKGKYFIAKFPVEKFAGNVVDALH